MSLISKMILKEWFKMLFAAFFSLSLLITTADFINGLLVGKSFSKVLMEYALKMPEHYGKIIPITCLIATLFSFNRLKNKSELIAIFSTGYSFSKIYLLLIFCSFFVAAFQFINLGYIEPYANKVERLKISKSQVSEGKYLTRSVVDGGRFWYRTSQYFASFLVFDRRKLSMIQPEIYRFGPNNKAYEIISAKNANYDIHSKKWIFKDGVSLSSLDQSGFPKENTFSQSSFSLNEKPEDFLEFEADLTTLPFENLYRFIKRIKKTGININEYEVLLYQKISLSLICIIFALIPLTSIFNPNRRSDSFGKNVVFTILFSIAFWILFSVSTSSGQNGKIPAVLSTFLVPIVFSIYVIFNYLRHRKLSF